MMRFLRGLPRSRHVAAAFVAIIALFVFAFGSSLSVDGSSPLGSLTSRVLAALVLPSLWLVSSLVQNGATQYLNAKIMSALNQAGVGGPKVVPTEKAGKVGNRDEREGEEELISAPGVVAARFNTAIGVLKKRQLTGARRRRWLYQLPWYVVIGLPGSGKTTAIVNSGLDFPLAKKVDGVVPAVAKTRDCEWWFTDDAVLIDTAGRYTRQAEGGTDRSEWLGFLRLLRRRRRRQPLNGVILTICVKELLSASEDVGLRNASLIRTRIAEVYRELRLRVPVYVLFTKSDLIAGFTEYFDDLGREGREAVWGMTFPLEDVDSVSPVERYEAEFAALIARLDERLMDRVQQEGELERRALVFGFPQQAASLKESTYRFIKEIFENNTFEAPFLLRGAYFVSGLQRGAPLDPVMDATSRTFGMAPRAPAPFGGRGRGYFIERFLREVAFVEAWIVGSDERSARRLRRARLAAGVGLTILLLLLGGMQVSSYAHGKAIVAAMDGAVEEYERKAREIGLEHVSDSDLRRIAPLLDQLRALRDRSAEVGRSPLALDLVGSRRRAKVVPELARTYEHALTTLLLPRMILRLEEEMGTHAADVVFLDSALEIYLVLGRRGPLDAARIKRWMQADWESAYPGSDCAALRASLAMHLDALLANPLETFGLDVALVERVRSVLRKVPLAQQVVDEIARSPQAAALAFWSVADHAGPLAGSVLGMRSMETLQGGVDGFYTREGFAGVFRSLLGQTVDRFAARGWILGAGVLEQGDAEARRRLQRDATGIYLQEFGLRWDRLINDIAVKPVATMDDAVRTLNVLSTPYSPIRLLVSSAAEATTLGPSFVPKAGVEAADLAVPAQPGGQSAPTALFKPQSEGDAVEAMARRYADEHFRSLHDLMRVPSASGPNARPPIDGAIAVLEGLYRSLTPEVAPQQGPLQQGAQSAGAIARVQAEAAHLPHPIKQWMLGISRSTADLSTDRARSALETLWNNGPGRLCREVTRAHYPFAAEGVQDASLGDFGRLFAAGGAIDSFFAKNLAPYVDTSGGRWRATSPNASQPLVSDAALQEFQRAALVRDGMFSGGGTTPSVDFELTVAALDPGTPSATLLIGGQRFTFARDTAAAPMRLRWPATVASEEVSITFDSGSLFQPPVVIGARGPWALFRLLQKASLHRSARGEEALVRLSAQGHSIELKLRADGVVNPLDGRMLSRFHCPPSL